MQSWILGSNTRAILDPRIQDYVATGLGTLGHPATETNGLRELQPRAHVGWLHCAAPSKSGHGSVTKVNRKLCLGMAAPSSSTKKCRPRIPSLWPQPRIQPTPTTSTNRRPCNRRAWRARGFVLLRQPRLWRCASTRVLRCAAPPGAPVLGVWGGGVHSRTPKRSFARFHPHPTRR